VSKIRRGGKKGENPLKSGGNSEKPETLYENLSFLNEGSSWGKEKKGEGG